MENMKCNHLSRDAVNVKTINKFALLQTKREKLISTAKFILVITWVSLVKWNDEVVAKNINNANNRVMS